MQLDKRTRRAWLSDISTGIGAMALAHLLQQDAAGEEVQSPAKLKPFDLLPRHGHHKAKATSMIQLFQNGGPSQMDLFDPKPLLNEQAGNPHPENLETFQLNNKNVLLGSPWAFKKYGDCGMDFASPLPHMAAQADQWCMIRSMHTVNNNHPFAISMFQSGKPFFGFPAIGSWLTYALGSENQNLPGYVVLRDPAGYNTSGKTVWSSGWMPALYQGTEFSSSGNAIAYLKPSVEQKDEVRQRNLKVLEYFNRKHLQEHPLESELVARMKNYQLAARMQLEASKILDLSDESEATLKMYGMDNPTTRGYATRCIMARRLIEAGVRYVQVFPPLKPSFQPWDSHNDLKNQIETISAHVDQPSAALVQDLKDRGLLEETIIVWSGEFGRLPITENANGRDHNRNAFTTLVAGGGFKAGFTYGATDEFGYAAVENRVSVPDLHATFLHQLGLDHTVLAYPHRGRNERLTDPEVTGARVVKELLG